MTNKTYFTNFESESIIPSIKKYLFHQRMVDFLNKLEISDQQYKTNGTVRDDNYKGNLLFTMKDFVSFVRHCQSVYFMSTRLLKYKIYGVRVPQLQLS